MEDILLAQVRAYLILAKSCENQRNFNSTLYYLNRAKHILTIVERGRKLNVIELKVA